MSRSTGGRTKKSRPKPARRRGGNTNKAGASSTNKPGRAAAAGDGGRGRRVGTNRARRSGQVRQLDTMAFDEALTLIAASRGAGDAPLTERQEEQLRGRCETAIRKRQAGFVVEGTALGLFQSQRLYKKEHKNFEAYCEQELGQQRQRAYELIHAAEVAMNVRNSGHDFSVLPANQYQATELGELETAEHQAEVWQRLVDGSHGSRITGRQIQNAVTAFMAELARQKDEEPDEEEAGEGDDAPCPSCEADTKPRAASQAEAGSPDSRSPVARRSARKDDFFDSAPGLLLRIFREPHPAPNEETVTPEHASRSWIHETTLPEEQRRRQQQLEKGDGIGYATERGGAIFITTFWALVRLGYIRKIGSGNRAMYELTEMGLATAEAHNKDNDQ